LSSYLQLKWEEPAMHCSLTRGTIALANVSHHVLDTASNAQVRMELAGVGLSVVTGGHEQLYARVAGIRMRCAASQARLTLELALRSVQARGASAHGSARPFPDVDRLCRAFWVQGPAAVRAMVATDARAAFCLSLLRWS